MASGNEEVNLCEQLEFVHITRSDSTEADVEGDDSGRKLSNNEETKETLDASQSSPQVKFNVDHYLCPITLEFMRDPVCTPYGHTFERTAIEDWIKKKGTCPMTKKPLSVFELHPCLALKSAIDEMISNESTLKPESSLYLSNINKSILEASNSNQQQQQLNQSSLNQSNMNSKERVTNKGGIRIADKCQKSSVQEWSAERMRREYHSNAFSLQSTFITFPPADSFLMFFATGYISIRNIGTEPIELASVRRGPGQQIITGGTFVLNPGESRGFDYRKFKWSIEVREGDASQLFVYDFATNGGGKGNALGMFIE